MENNHKLTLYVSYYLSRFNDEALAKLKYTTWNNAFEDIGQRLNVKPHSVKNWRDEFDPLFGHRAGWHQRPMSSSKVKVKGLAHVSAGVLFTDKEWQTDIEKNKSYYLAIVRNLNNTSQINFLQNPAVTINPTKNIYTTIQICWRVTKKSAL